MSYNLQLTASYNGLQVCLYVWRTLINDENYCTERSPLFTSFVAFKFNTILYSHYLKPSLKIKTYLFIANKLLHYYINITWL